MDQPLHPPPASRRLWAGRLVLFMVLAASVWIQCWNLPATYHGGRWLLPDPDDYARLIRVRMILEGRASVVRVIPELHPPAGVELHWTAPMDYVLVGAVKLSRLFAGPSLRIESVAAWTPVGLGLAYLSLVYFFLSRAAGIAIGAGAAALVVISPSFHRAFLLGHCDHHCLLELLMMISLYLWLLRGENGATFGGPSRRACWLSGVAMGLAIWVSPLALPAWAAILAGATFATFHACAEHRHGWIRRRTEWTIAVLAVLLVAWGAENQPDVWRFVADKISVLHVLLVAASLSLPAGRCNKDRINRLRWFLCPAAIGVVAWLIFMRRGELTGPFASPEFYRWSAMITELQPLVLVGDGGEWTIIPLIRRLGLIPAALPVLIWFLVRGKAVHCMAKVSLSLLALGMTCLAIGQVRWIDHYNLAVIPVLIIGMSEAHHRIKAGSTLSRGAACITLLSILVFPSAAGVLTPPSGKLDPFMTRLAQACDAIKQDHAAHPDEATSTILSEYDAGPMLLFETRLPVVAGPYHRALPGIVEAAQFFAERDDARALAFLTHEKIGYVVTPYRPAEQLRIMERIAFGELRSYEPSHRKVENGDLYESITFKPEIKQTVSYRLAQCEHTDSLGLRVIEKIDEGAATSDGKSGLVYAANR